MTEPSTYTPRPGRKATILGYIGRFSATERALFSLLVIAALISALIMGKWVNDYFSVDVPAYGGSLTEGIIGLPRTVNPILAVTDADRDISALVYSGLAKYEHGALVTDLAQSYDISEDGLVYTFTLKPKLQFHDGEPLTTEDIAFTIQKIQDPVLKSPRRADWADVTVEVVSPTEVKFILKQPYRPFLSNTTIGILPKHVWGSVSDEQFIFSQYNIEPIGSGPYRFDKVSYNAGGIPTTYKLSSWSGYHGRVPYISQVIFKFFADEETALDALDQGSIDSLPSVPPAAATNLARTTAQSYTVISSPLPRVFGVFFNQSQSPILADRAVRVALDAALDRQAIVDAVLDGYGLPLDRAVPFLAIASSTDSTGPSIDPATTSPFIANAEAILDRNGWKKNDGVYEKKTSSGVSTISFDIYTADSPDLKRAVEMIRDTWNELGAQVNIKVYETGDLYQNIIRTREYDALFFGQSIGKDRDFYAFWHSSQRNAPGLNVALYTNTKTDKLLEDIRMIGDEDLRAEKYAEFDELLTYDVPATFVYLPDFIYAIPRTLGGIQLDTMTSPADRWNGVRDWYIETERVWKIFD